LQTLPDTPDFIRIEPRKDKSAMAGGALKRYRSRSVAGLRQKELSGGATDPPKPDSVPGSGILAFSLP
jgi:hypothetical protein